MLYSLILAGGKGTRLYPLSRSSNPKQFLSIHNNGKSFLSNTVDRIRPIIHKDNIYVVTNQEYEDKIRDELKDIREENIFTEPANKETATCIGLSAAKLLKKDKDAVMIVLPSDHYIEGDKSYLQTLEQAVEIADKKRAIVTIGIEPTRPETGYGYIEMGDRVNGHIPTFKIARFTEKPNLEVAKDFLLKGTYLWNSGMFIFRADALITKMRCRSKFFRIVCIHVYPPRLNKLVVLATSYFFIMFLYILVSLITLNNKEISITITENKNI
ncbi:mannose-1-phosphate guanylyltransferase [Clostridium perfringens]|nr:mannose-1-phosphate guanylyltransferase [Clostridium perfringens]MDM0621384.1 mannose-1-phosphate guanylyltransferase [Clostridium perfringens]UBK30440.1 mannose-1-phosphate guanylyltransferase [Clostridium perfringens]